MRDRHLIATLFVMLLAACLWTGPQFPVHPPSVHGQQVAKRGKGVIQERGVLESAQSVDIRNLLPGQTAILKVVPEGMKVKKGDELVRLEATAFEDLINRRQHEAAQTLADLKQAEAELESIRLEGASHVEIANRKLELVRAEKERVLGETGELAVERRIAESEITIAKAQLQAAQVILQQVESDLVRTAETQLGITEASEKLKVADLRLRFLEGPQLTHATAVHELAIAEATAELQRSRIHLERSVEAASAILAARQTKLALAKRELDRSQDLLSHCRIVAPVDGMVVYHTVGGRRAPLFVLEPGATVRERQTLLRLVDPSQLQLRLHVNDANAEGIRVGQRATIKIDAFPDRLFPGKVKQIDGGPAPRGQQAVIVAFDTAPSQAKLGMTAHIEIQTGAGQQD